MFCLGGNPASTSHQQGNILPVIMADIAGHSEFVLLIFWPQKDGSMSFSCLSWELNHEPPARWCMNEHARMLWEIAL